MNQQHILQCLYTRAHIDQGYVLLLENVVTRGSQEPNCNSHRSSGAVFNSPVSATL